MDCEHAFGFLKHFCAALEQDPQGPFGHALPPRTTPGRPSPRMRTKLMISLCIDILSFRQKILPDGPESTGRGQFLPRPLAQPCHLGQGGSSLNPPHALPRTLPPADIVRPRGAQAPPACGSMVKPQAGPTRIAVLVFPNRPARLFQTLAPAVRAVANPASTPMKAHVRTGKGCAPRPALSIGKAPAPFASPIPNAAAKKPGHRYPRQELEMCVTVNAGRR